MADSVDNAASATAQAIQWPVNKADYTILKTVGSGATSTVYEAAVKSLNDKKCAIKIINLEKCSSTASLDEINKEIMSMKNLKHENIVMYYASFVSGTELFIVMDLCQRGSLLDLIKHTQKTRDISSGVFDEAVIATILRDVLRGLSYIHENGLVHRDVKCGNLLVKDDGVIQIADFGVAGFLAIQPISDNSSKVRHTFVGTPCWMAPEVMQQTKGYNHKADIWSLGITAIELATGQAPYAKYAPMKVLMLTLQNDPPDIDSAATSPNQYANYGHKIRKFIKCCLMKDPSLRTSAKDLLSHPFIKNKAKDKDLLVKTLLSGEIPPPPVRMRHDEKKTETPKGASAEWNFDESGNLRVANHDDSDSDYEYNHLPGPAAANQVTNAAKKSAAVQYRITLRKRNPAQNNELQDISFNYVPGKDSTDVLAHELVEAGLLDGCDFVLVAHNMQELVAKPEAKERVFALNSPPVQGQLPNESELHGFAKVLIRVVPPETGGSQPNANQPAASTSPKPKS